MKDFSWKTFLALNKRLPDAHVLETTNIAAHREWTLQQDQHICLLNRLNDCLKILQDQYSTNAHTNPTCKGGCPSKITPQRGHNSTHTNSCVASLEDKGKRRPWWDRVVHFGIIGKVPQWTTTTTWCAQMVVTLKKNGDPRHTASSRNWTMAHFTKPFTSPACSTLSQLCRLTPGRLFSTLGTATTVSLSTNQLNRPPHSTWNRDAIDTWETPTQEGLTTSRLTNPLWSDALTIPYSRIPKSKTHSGLPLSTWRHAATIVSPSTRKNFVLH